MFKSTLHKGFQITFENGYTISVQWGTGNYCENNRPSVDHSDQLVWLKRSPEYSSPDAEIAIWNKDNVWYDFGYDTVKGYCSADEVADWIIKVKNFKSKQNEDSI